MNQINSDKGFERLVGNYESLVSFVPVTGLDREMVIDFVKRRNMEFKILINAGEIHIPITLMPLGAYNVHKFSINDQSN